MLGGVEIISRNRDSLRREIAEEARANAGRLELPLHLAVIAGGGADEFVDFLHLDDVALESGNLGDRCDAALAVGKALQLHDHADGGGDLPADRGDGHRQAGHADHLLEARDRVARGIGVDGGHRAFVAGVHRLQHVEGFLAAALAEDDAVGPHAERVLDEFALANFALALDVRRPGFHAADMRLLQLQFRRVLDGDEALLFGNEGRQGVEHRRLAGAGAAGDDERHARTDAAISTAICGRIAPMSTSLLRLKGFFENLRIETSGPSTAIGRTATLTREPSRRRASHKGCDSSTRRPTAETILLTMRRRCDSSLKRTGVGSKTPLRSTKTHSWPLIRISLTLGSLSKGSIGPRPVISSRISATKSSSSCALSGRRSASVYCETSP